MATLTRIPLNQINKEPAPTSNRHREGLAVLGQQQPVILAPNGNGMYDIVEGRGRVLELEELGESDVWAIVKEMARTEKIWAALALNMGRRENPMGEAELIEQVLAMTNPATGNAYTQTEIAQRIGVSQPLVSRRTELLPLIPELRLRVKLGKEHPQGMAVNAGYAAAKLPPDLQRELAAFEGKLTIKMVKAILDRYISEDVLDLDSIDIPDLDYQPPAGLFLTGEMVERLMAGETVEVIYQGKAIKIREESGG